MGKVKNLVVLGDLHCGSTCGLMPPTYTTLEGQEVRANALQRWFHDCWEHYWAWVDKTIGEESYYLLLMGDLIEGIHHGTTEVVSPELHDHAGIALALLQGPARRSAGVFVIEGTECHTRNIEHSIARSLGAKPNPDTNQFAWHSFKGRINGTLIHASHHVGTTTRPYLESGQYSPTIAAERLSATCNNQDPPDLILRAHRHKFGLFHDSSGAMAVSPCWQGLTRHGRKVVPDAMPQCGGLLVQWDDDDDWHVRTKIYKVAKKEAARL